jgi:hypothetical protein
MGQDKLPDFAGPIWLAALVATGCEAVSDRECHQIGWNWVRGRAVYTNLRARSEEIRPLGVTVARGETLAVTWEPGETEYTLHVDRPAALCA